MPPLLHLQLLCSPHLLCQLPPTTLTTCRLQCPPLLLHVATPCPPPSLASYRPQLFRAPTAHGAPLFFACSYFMPPRLPAGRPQLLWSPSLPAAPPHLLCCPRLSTLPPLLLAIIDLSSTRFPMMAYHPARGASPLPPSICPKLSPLQLAAIFFF